VIKEGVEVVSTKNVLTNLFLVKVNQGTPLDERFFGQKPNLNKLRTFGSIIHVHVANDKCKKLNPKFLCCVLVSKPRLSNVIIHPQMK
jgi:hypothetical protein